MSALKASELAVLFANAGHFADDIVNIQNHLHHTDLILINVRIKFFLHFRFAHMENLESQRDPCQWTGVGRVTISDRLSSETGSLTFRSAQQNHNVLSAILLGELLNTLLIFQIQCTSGRSDETLR